MKNISLPNSRLNVQFPSYRQAASVPARVPVVIWLFDQLLAAQDITPDIAPIARCFCYATVCASKM